MDKIRTGLAAYGMSGRVFHAPFISTNPHFELTAVTERSKELSREKYPDACIVRSFEELNRSGRAGFGCHQHAGQHSL